jgi:hypothetical protein
VEQYRISEEALKLLEKVKRGRDSIGDLDWWECDDGKKAFGWLGGFCRIINPDDVEGSRNYKIFKDDCVIIPNDVPFGAKDVLDEPIQ